MNNRASGRLWLAGLILLASMPLTARSQNLFNLNATTKYSLPFTSIVCNKDTVIDFDFSPSSVLNSCSSTNNSCSTNSPSQSSLNFLNFEGHEQKYTLSTSEAERDSYTVSDRSEGNFKFTFTNGAKTVKVIVPFRSSFKGSSQAVHELDLNGALDSSLSTLQSLTNQFSSGGLALSAFNFLNKRDFGLFYHVADSGVSTTYLLNYWVLIIPSINTSALEPFSDDFSSSGSFTPDYATTGDKLCYGSLTEGIFQTHLRESYPLWTAWIAILLFWLFVLLSKQSTLLCYDKDFDNQKWTCWALYSLFFLGHEDYFTKLSRTTLVLITFSWQGVCLAALYGTIGPQFDATTIPWFAAIALITSMPFTFGFGYFFLQSIYESTLHKYKVLKDMKGVFNKKDGLQPYEKQIDSTEEKLYGLYYWYYVAAFLIFTVCWVVSIHLMMQLSRDFYHLMYYWYHFCYTCRLAALGCSFVLDHLVFDPFLTFLLGNTSFYRTRGFFYDFRLGQSFKEVEE